MTGYVVTRPFRTSNIGSNLASMAGALWLARSLDRTLLVDWRGLTQLRLRERSDLGGRDQRDSITRP